MQRPRPDPPFIFTSLRIQGIFKSSSVVLHVIFVTIYAKKHGHKYVLNALNLKSSYLKEKYRYLISWCFEPSQPHRITSGLETNVSTSPTYSAQKSSHRKTQQNPQNSYQHKYKTKRVRACCYRRPFSLIYRYQSKNKPTYI